MENLQEKLIKDCKKLDFIKERRGERSFDSGRALVSRFKC